MILIESCETADDNNPNQLSLNAVKKITVLLFNHEIKRHLFLFFLMAMQIY